MGWGCSSVVEHLLSKYKALNLIPRNKKREKKRDQYLPSLTRDHSLPVKMDKLFRK
jgi:hypothetical protein